LQIHWHWTRSEHKINGASTAGELHLVFQSLKNPNQLAVVGIFLKVFYLFYSSEVIDLFFNFQILL
jgi:carbonic anhydrase